MNEYSSRKQYSEWEPCINGTETFERKLENVAKQVDGHEEASFNLR